MKLLDTIELTIDDVMRDSLHITGLTLLTFTVAHILVRSAPFQLSFFAILKAIALITILYIALIIAHEACHLIDFIIFGRAPLTSLKFGLNLELGVAYATTTKCLSNRAMKAALMLPFWLTAVLPTLIGFYYDNYPLIVVGALLTGGAAGDFEMYRGLRKFPNHVLVKDDTEKPRLFIYEKSDEPT